MTWWSGQYRGEIERCKTKAKDTVAVNTIGMEPNAPLAYDQGSEHHHPTMSIIGG